MVWTLIIGILLFIASTITIFFIKNILHYILVIVGLVYSILFTSMYFQDVGYKQGQSDYIEGNIKFEQVIKADTTYIEIK